MMSKLARVLCLLTGLLPLSALAETPTLYLDGTGVAAFVQEDERIAYVFMGLSGPEEKFTSQLGAEPGVPEGSGNNRSYVNVLPIKEVAQAQIRYTLNVTARDPGSAEFSYSARIETPTGPTTLNQFFVSLYLEADEFAGRDLFIEQQPQPLSLPAVEGEAGLIEIKAPTGVSIALPDGSGTLSVGSAGFSGLQVWDRRVWGGEHFEIRFVVDAEFPVRDGDRLSFALNFSVAPSLEVAFEGKEFITDTSDWSTFAATPATPDEGTIVDVSSLLHRPAGKYGKLKAVGDRFEFADRPGVPVRFFGTNVSLSACCPQKDDAEKIADRFARFGLNLVRVHALDAPSVSIIDYARGDSRSLNPAKLDLFDYFFKQLKDRGIYLQMDLLSKRQAMSGDGIEKWQRIPIGWKAYAIFDPTMIALQKEYAFNLFTHVNPYTGLAYKDDPALALITLINEANLLYPPLAIETYEDALKTLWRKWRKENGLPSAIPSRGTEYKQFADDTTTAYYDDMRAYLRTTLGIEIPIAGSNQNHGAPVMVSDAKMDFTEGHGSWDHPKFRKTLKEGQIWSYLNNPMVDVSPFATGQKIVFARQGGWQVPGRPFVVGEGSAAFPNAYRAEYIPWFAATAGIQGWDGVALYTYAESAELPNRVEMPFGWALDPARYATLPAAAVMVHGGHVRPSAIRAIVRIPDPYAEPNGFSKFGTETTTGLEKYRLVTSIENVPRIPGPGPTDGDVLLLPGDTAIDPSETSAGDPEGQLVHDWGKGTVLINTEKTQAVIGFVGGRTHYLDDTVFAVETPFAVVMVTSLDDKPIRWSKHMLITAVARVENSGQTYWRYLLHRSLYWTQDQRGAAPILSEPVRATVTLPARRDRYQRVWALDHLGRRAAEIPVVDNRVEIGASATSHWYEVRLFKGASK